MTTESDIWDGILATDVEYPSGGWLKANVDDAGATLTLQTINDAIWPPITVIVPTGTADEIRARVEADLGEEGKRRVTITESGMVSPGIAYIYNPGRGCPPYIARR